MGKIQIMGKIPITGWAFNKEKNYVVVLKLDQTFHS